MCSLKILSFFKVGKDLFKQLILNEVNDFFQIEKGNVLIEIQDTIKYEASLLNG